MQRRCLLTPAVLLLAVMVLGAARPAAAGVCLDDQELGDYAQGLERFADGGRPPSAYWLLCLKSSAKFQPRVVAACTKIVEGYDPAAAVSPAVARKAAVQADCVMALAHAKVTNAGSLDTVAALLDRDWSPRADINDRVSTLLANGDARVKPLVIAKLTENLAAMRGKPLKGWRASAWIRWQRSALRVLDKHGTAADLAAVDAILADAQNKGLRRAATAVKTTLAAR